MSSKAELIELEDIGLAEALERLMRASDSEYTDMELALDKAQIAYIRCVLENRRRHEEHKWSLHSLFDWGETTLAVLLVCFVFVSFLALAGGFAVGTYLVAVAHLHPEALVLMPGWELLVPVLLCWLVSAVLWYAKCVAGSLSLYYLRPEYTRRAVMGIGLPLWYFILAYEYVPRRFTDWLYPRA